MPAPWKISWTKSLSCKSQRHEEQVHVPVTISAVSTARSSRGCSKSLLKDVIHGNTVKVPAPSKPSSNRAKALPPTNKVWCSEIQQLKQQQQHQEPGRSTKVVRKFGAGCHGCNVADESFIFHREQSRSLYRIPHPTCHKCGEIFSKYESLELHHVVKHAVTELGRGDSSKNIVEIIFRTSWLKKELPGLKMERILKINNTQRTISRFEEYRDAVKSRASALQKKHPRCIADGNELLRFHAARLSCNLGANSSSSVCSSHSCTACRIIRSGFPKTALIHTTATSGRAHDALLGRPDGPSWSSEEDENEEQELNSRTIHAMLVCRVIAGRMHKGFPGDGGAGGDVPGGFDSIAGELGPFSNVDDLYVQSSRAVLPCFVVIYTL